VALETADALPRAEIKRLIRQAYDLVFAKLPKKPGCAGQVRVGYTTRVLGRSISLQAPLNIRFKWRL